MKIFKKNYFYITTLCFLTFFLGFISISFRPNFPLGDGEKYNQIAKTIIEDHTFPLMEGDLHKPGYIFFLATVYYIFGFNNQISIFIFQFAFLLGTAIICFFIGDKFLKFSKIKSFLASLITLFWPYLILYSSLLLTEILYIFLFMTSLFYIIRFTRNQSYKNAFFSAIFLLLTVLVRPIPLLFIPWLLIFTVATSKFHNFKLNKEFFKKLIVHYLVFFCLLMPWSIYASKKTGNLTLITNVGGSIIKNSNIKMQKEYSVYNTPGYSAGDKWTFKKFIKSKIKNIYRFWKSGAEGYNVEILIQKFPPAKYLIWLYRVFYFLMLFLAFLSIFLISKKEIFILWQYVLYTWAVHVALFPYPRFTLPVIPVMILLSFYTLTNRKKIKQLIKNNIFLNKKPHNA